MLKETFCISGYPYKTQIATRWQDCDAYGHVNNAVYYSFFDTAVTTMLYERHVLSSGGSAQIGLCVESACVFHQSLSFPSIVTAWVRIAEIRSKSIRYEIALLEGNCGTAAATGHFVHVFVDRVTRRSAAISETTKAALSDLVMVL